MLKENMVVGLVVIRNIKAVSPTRKYRKEDNTNPKFEIEPRQICKYSFDQYQRQSMIESDNEIENFCITSNICSTTNMKYARCELLEPESLMRMGEINYD